MRRFLAMIPMRALAGLVVFKVMNLVAILIAPFVAAGSLAAMSGVERWAIVIVSFLALAAAVFFSKRTGEASIAGDEASEPAPAAGAGSE